VFVGELNVAVARIRIAGVDIPTPFWDQQIILTLTAHGFYQSDNFRIDWGDGNIDTFAVTTVTGFGDADIGMTFSRTHTYASGASDTVAENIVATIESTNPGTVTKK